MNNEIKMIQDVKKYYGQILKGSKDLKTSACCLTESLPKHLRNIVQEIHEEVNQKFYGCGSPIPSLLEGRTVLDLGCGSGRDSFILSKLVGPKGRVIGVDMTEEQLFVAKNHLKYHTDKFGYAEPNIKFLNGYIEDLKNIGIEDNSVDVIISNCVLNLSPNKKQVFSEIFRVLKPGGELYFSDVFAGRRIPEELTKDPVLLGECLGGALYIEDFRRILAKLGCHDYRVVAKSRLSLNDPDIKKKAGMIDFYSMTLRAFKLSLEDRCEDYGQVAYYLGGLPEFPNAFKLDDHHLIEKGKPFPVCRNTADMLSKTRYAPYFKIDGDTSTHFGLFNCAPEKTGQENKNSSACC